MMRRLLAAALLSALSVSSGRAASLPPFELQILAKALQFL
jgi:hypothetical protein